MLIAPLSAEYQIDNETHTNWEMKCNRWVSSIESNQEGFAADIAESIAKKVFRKIEKRLNYFYVAHPSSSDPLQFSFSLNICNPEKVYLIKNLAMHTFNHPLFNEWFQILEEQNEYYLPFLPLKKEKLEFFQKQMYIIGNLVESQIPLYLRNFNQRNKNKMKFNIKWNSHHNKNFQKNFEDNSLLVQAWVNQNGNHKDNEEISDENLISEDGLCTYL